MAKGKGKGESKTPESSATGRFISDRLRGAVEKVSDRFNAVKQAAIDKDRARAALGNRLVATGLALLFLGGGLDYVERADRMRDALTSYARDAGQTGLANAVESVEQTVQRYKERAFLSLPHWLQNSLPYLALMSGLASMGCGLVVKLGMEGGSRGQTLRDVGRALAAPGAVGSLAMGLLTWRAAAVVNLNTKHFFMQVERGELDGSALWEMTRLYAPQSWDELGIFLVLGLLLLAQTFVLLLVLPRLSGPRLFVIDLVRRSGFWLGVLFCGLFLLGMAISVISYGSGLIVLTLPLHPDPKPVLVTALLLSFGMGMARAGSARIKREQQRAAEAEA